MTDLAHHIAHAPLVDTHEHLHREQVWTTAGPDILQDLFGNYVTGDLVSAGAAPDAVERLTAEAPDRDIAALFAPVQEAWQRVRFTGYGRATAEVARRFYGVEELTVDTLAAAAEHGRSLQRPGERLRLLRDEARLDHTQIDDSRWPCEPDEADQSFFLYDLSWFSLSRGDVEPAALHAATGVEVTGLDSLDEAMAALFAAEGGRAVAVKTQHAYARTLRWEERSRSEASAALRALLHKGAEGVDYATSLCLGDWCLARGVEHAIEHQLPFKIHTGYYAGNDRMPLDLIRPSNLCGLLERYLDARFVLMHIAYPYQAELLSLAKHYRNVWVDLCWAWSIDPRSSGEWLRRWIHTAPVNKLFAFGGDTRWPTSAFAYALQAREGIAAALDAEVAVGDISEAEAMEVATRIMHANQYECFDIAGTRAAIAQSAA